MAESTTDNKRGFNDKAAQKALTNWYKDNKDLRKDIRFGTDRIFDIDDHLQGQSGFVHPIQVQVQKMIHSGKTEKEIGDALTKAVKSLTTDFHDQTGRFTTKNSRNKNNVTEAILQTLTTQNPNMTGKSDEDLNKAYKDFSAYLDKDLNKMFKDMPYENREALVTHIKSDKSNADKIIKAEAMKLLKESGSDYDASGLLKKLSQRP